MSKLLTASIYKFCLSGTIYMVKRKEAVNMKLQSITEKQIQKFRKYLANEEKSDATIEKYIRDVTAFVKWLGGEIPRKERVIQYSCLFVFSCIAAYHYNQRCGKFLFETADYTYCRIFCGKLVFLS